jgi:hypothetical protein
MLYGEIRWRKSFSAIKPKKNPSPLKLFQNIFCQHCATGEDLTVVDSTGMQVGVRITIEYICEYGHHGEIILQVTRL